MKHRSSPDPRRAAADDPAPLPLPSSPVRAFCRAALLLLLLSSPLSAALTLKAPTALTSRSGQFIVFAPNPALADRDPATSLTSTNEVRLEQGPLTITCDRIRDIFLQELGVPGLAQGKIYVHLQPALPGSEIILKPLRFGDGWQYQLSLPTRLDRSRLVTAIVHTLLQEMANRANPARLVNVPHWLVEGMATQVLIAGGPALVPELRRTLVVEVTKRDHFAHAREELRQNGVLSFSDLNLPSPAQLSGPGWQTYRHSSQLFVSSLFQLREGNLCLARFIRELGNYLNPQLAFLKAFAMHFGSALEIEKWWSVTALNLTGRDHRMNWTQTVSLQRLDEILTVSAQLASPVGAPPRPRPLRLQEAISQFDFSHQQRLFANTLRQLEFLQRNAPPDFSRLVTDYRTTLATYLQERGRIELRSDFRNRVAGGHIAVTQITLKQLDLLDVIREDFRQAADPAFLPSPAPR